MKINAYYPVLCVENVKQTAAFYQQHFYFDVGFENDWYTHLTMRGNENVNLAFVVKTHASIPERFQNVAQGMLLNIEMDEIDSLYQELRSEGVPILLELRDEPWGQRHFILSDPAGVMIDVIQLIEPSEEFKAHYE